ncbi:MAG: penicillin-binding protein 1B, partial [Gammaproteobacteria bacterium]|nr:penicillin-binding protein 1B [Gammaproteobacteria bacterium]
MAKQAGKFSWPWRFTWQLLIVLAVCTLAMLVYLDAQVRDRFEGHRWSLPAKVYARPLELYIGKQLAQGQLNYELQQLGYRAVKKVRQAGQY